MLSPEFRDMLDMEIWYKNIGDEYALWLIRTVDDLQNQLALNESLLCDKIEIIDDLESELHELQYFVLNEMSELTDEKDFKILEKTLARMTEIILKQ